MNMDPQTGKLYDNNEDAISDGARTIVGLSGYHNDILRISRAVKQKYDAEQRKKNRNRAVRKGRK